MKKEMLPNQELIQEAISYMVPDILTRDPDSLDIRETTAAEEAIEALMPIALQYVKDPDEAYICLERSLDNLRG